jgi:hypothetical protein
MGKQKKESLNSKIERFADKRLSALFAVNQRAKRRFINKLQGRKWRRRMEMLIYAIPNLIITVVAVLSFGLTLGWDKLIQFPYILLWLFLLQFGGFAFLMKWDEPIEEEKDRQQLTDDIVEKVSNNMSIPLNKISEANQKLTQEIQELIKRIDERWPK